MARWLKATRHRLTSQPLRQRASALVIGERRSAPPAAIIDYGYYRALSAMGRSPRYGGHDAAKSRRSRASLAREYNARTCHTDSAGNAWYANNTEASNAVALDAGLVPAQYHQAVVSSLVAAVQAYGDRIGTGSVALGPLFRALHAAGQDSLLYQMVTNPNAPSYAYLVNQGATTLEENLSGTGGSKDHQFLGDVASWFVHQPGRNRSGARLDGVQETRDQAGDRRRPGPRRRHLHHTRGPRCGQLGAHGRQPGGTECHDPSQYNGRSLGSHLRQARNRSCLGTLSSVSTAGTAANTPFTTRRPAHTVQQRRVSRQGHSRCPCAPERGPGAVVTV